MEGAYRENGDEKMGDRVSVQIKEARSKWVKRNVLR